ncbi:hypothetical protein AJ79_02176 [Helicocarpus griseus UAMH5409]|uniref:TauD/TfdA-like domain-containing protein n=1 Tax=Helicocarpus griseus UAMH5409 TaxID=1447875 RepID=A0A2B7Y3L2_9EURO|nr:hypothetical protein AJ79_02176 [Helicocarpus griseus UAMH5409]
MPKDHIDTFAYNTPATLMPETDMASTIKQTNALDPLVQEKLNLDKENSLHIFGLSTSYYAAEDGNSGITVSIENKSDIVVEKVREPDNTQSVTSDEKMREPVLYGPKTSEEVSNGIVSILERYRMAPKERAHEPWEAKTKFANLIKEHIECGETIPMVLPAFPFKSPNKTFKVLGFLPDKGEEVALAHLNGLCKLIEDEYRKGARVDIVSDGLMYNGITDKQVWTYGQALRKLAADTGCSNINFVRLVHLLGESEMGEPLSEEQYLKDAPYFRTQLHERNIPENFDVSAYIAKDPDTILTYRGYIKFLEKDLDDNGINDGTMSKRQIKKRHEETARNMIARGRAFAIAIAKRFDKSVRLSIHPSTESTKISIAITPNKNGMIMTPWHSSLVRAVDGSIHMAHAGSVPALTHELIFENGRPSYFREKSSLYDWAGVDIDIHYTYPSGIIISPRNKTCKHQFSRVDMRKVRALAELCSPVVLRGWLDTPNQSCCFETDIETRICRHGNIRVVDCCDGTTQTTPAMNGIPRGQPEADRYEANKPKELSSEGDIKHATVPLLQNGHAEIKAEAPRIKRPPTNQQNRRQTEERLSSNMPKPPKSHLSWKVMKDWSDMCIVS